MLDPISPTSMANKLATYITDPSTIRVRVLEYFGRAPSLEQCRNLRESHLAQQSKPTLCGERFARFNCGHDYTVENTVICVNGFDRCKTCADEKAAKTAERAAKQKAIDAAIQASLKERMTALQRDHEARLRRREEARLARVPFTSDALQRVADVFQIDVDDIKGPRRTQGLVDARAVAAMLYRERGLSYPQIARAIGRTDHSTALNLLRTFDRRAKARPELLTALEAAR